MKKITFIQILLLTITFSYGQKPNQQTTKIPFSTIVDSDFSKLIGVTPGVNFDYNSDKAVLKGTFGLYKRDKRYLSIDDATKGFWIQGSGSIGTTSKLFDLSQNIPQPDFSLSLTFTKIVKVQYDYDGCFNKKYKEIQSTKSPEKINGYDCLDYQIREADKFSYTRKLQEKLKGQSPKIDSTEKLYTLKNLVWYNITPEWGGTKYTFFDKSRSYSDQFYNPYFQDWGINLNLNYYRWLNNEDVKWEQGGPTTHFFYANVALRFGTNNNTDGLKKSTINDITNTITNPTTNATRQVIKSNTAYTGIYESYTAATPSFEILYSLSPIFAFDVFGNYNFITSKKEITSNFGNIAGGLYFFTNQNKSKFNIGIYYQSSISVSPVKQIIGLKTKIPISVM